MSLASFENALNDPQVLAWLDMISVSEGTTRYGYHTLVGGSYFADLSKFPYASVSTRYGTSTAAGRYQIIDKTWNGLVRQYGFQDFSEHTQDLAAVALTAGRGALGLVQSGQIEQAIYACNKEWASFTGSPYNQRPHPINYLLDAYNQALANRSGGQAQDNSASSDGSSSSDQSNGDTTGDTSSDDSSDGTGGAAAVVGLAALAFVLVKILRG